MINFGLLIYHSLNLNAQVLPFTNYGRKEGLPWSEVTNIGQDNQGYLWISTYYGFCKFDGKKFKIVNTDGYGFIVNDSISGSLYFGTNNGIYKNRGISQRLLVVKNPQNSVVQNLSFNSPFDLDASGHIWKFSDYSLLECTDSKVIQRIKTKQRFLHYSTTVDNANNVWAYSYQGDGFLIYSISSKKYRVFKENLPFTSIRQILFDENNNAWFFTELGMYSFDGAKFIHFDHTSLSNKSIDRACFDRKGRCWICTNFGLFLYDGNSFKHFTTSNGLPSNRIECVFEDRSGVIWIGSPGGLTKFDHQKFELYQVQSGLASNEVLSTYVDSSGNVYFGTEKGLSVKSGQTFRTYNERDGLSGFGLFTVLARDKEIWVGQILTGIKKFNGSRFVHFPLPEWDKITKGYTHPQCFLEDHKGHLWMGFAFGAIRYDGTKMTYFDGLNTGNSIVDVKHILQGKNGEYWFSTTFGWVKYDGKNFKKFTKSDGLPDDRLYSSVQLDDKTFWIATMQGLSHFDGKKFTNYSKLDDGTPLLTNNLIYDQKAHLWFGYQNGIGKINIYTCEIKTYGFLDGFLPIEVYPNSVSRDKWGNLWWGTKQGAVKYILKEDTENYTEATLHLEKVKIGNSEHAQWNSISSGIDSITGLPIHLKLPYDQNQLTFEYVGIMFRSSERLQYQYMLEGNEHHWSPTTSETFANYTNLRPGKYTFKLKSKTSVGTWNTVPSTYSFVVLPPWWETWWFYSLEILIIVSLFFGSILFMRTQRRLKVSFILFFLTLLIMIEFLAMYIEGFADEYSGGVPLVKLLVNILLAVSFHPVEKLGYNFLKRFKRKN